MNQAKVNQTAGWRAKLELQFQFIAKQTRMTRNRHSGPLMVQRPFYPEADTAHVYLLHPPGGVVGGDKLQIKVSTGPQASVLLTSPGAGKFYRSHHATATMRVDLHVGADSSLEWLPQENIIFNGARLNNETHIYIEKNGQFIGWEITCLGRPHSHETFTQGHYQSTLHLYHNQQLKLIEHQQINDQKGLDAASTLRGYPLQACLLVFPSNQQQLQAARKQLATLTSSNLIAVTLCDEILILRALGQDTEQLKNQLTQIWQSLRPMLLQRHAVAPRIWST